LVFIWQEPEPEDTKFVTYGHMMELTGQLKHDTADGCTVDFLFSSIDDNNHAHLHLYLFVSGLYTNCHHVNCSVITYGPKYCCRKSATVCHLPCVAVTLLSCNGLLTGCLPVASMQSCPSLVLALPLCFSHTAY